LLLLIIKHIDQKAHQLGSNWQSIHVGTTSYVLLSAHYC